MSLPALASLRSLITPFKHTACPEIAGMDTSGEEKGFWPNAQDGESLKSSAVPGPDGLETGNDCLFFDSRLLTRPPVIDSTQIQEHDSQI